MSTAADRRLAAAAARLAGRLALDVAAAGAAASEGVGKFVSGRAGRHDGDIDLAKSVEGLLEARLAGRPVSLEDLWVRHWRKPLTALTVVVDRSGSMSPPRLAAAAVVAAACALRAPREWCALAFGAEVVALKSLNEPRSANAVVEDVLRLRGYGTTDLAAALRAAHEQLERGSARRRLTLILSDCRATAGGDALSSARRLDELCVLAPAADAEDARAFAARAGARFATVRDVRDAARAVRAVVDRGAHDHGRTVP